MAPAIFYIDFKEFHLNIFLSHYSSILLVISLVRNIIDYRKLQRFFDFFLSVNNNFMSLTPPMMMNARGKLLLIVSFNCGFLLADDNDDEFFL